MTRSISLYINVSEIEDISELTNKFQEIYAFSFDTTIDIDSCKQMAIKATALQSSCEI
ncbi:YugE family protein [Mammaliicoccus vitulinus]